MSYEYGKENDKEFITAVKCSICGDCHNVEGETFIRIFGNILLGMSGGLIGNNFNDEGFVKSSVYICRNTDCLDSLYYYLLDGEWRDKNAS